MSQPKDKASVSLKCQNWALNPHSADQKHQSSSPVLLTARPQHPTINTTITGVCKNKPSITNEQIETNLCKRFKITDPAIICIYLVVINDQFWIPVFPVKVPAEIQDSVLRIAYETDPEALDYLLTKRAVALG